MRANKDAVSNLQPYVVELQLFVILTAWIPIRHLHRNILSFLVGRQFIIIHLVELVSWKDYANSLKEGHTDLLDESTDTTLCRLIQLLVVPL